MTYVQPRTDPAEILLSIARILLPLGAIVAIWLMAPAAANAAEGTGALNDPVGTVTDVVVTTQTPSDTVEQGSVGSTAGAATGAANKVTDTVGSTAGAATGAANKVADTVGSTAGAATGAANKVTDTVGSTAAAATGAARRATDSVTDTVGSTAGTATDAVGNTSGAVADTIDSTTGTVVETAKPLVVRIAPTVGEVGGDVVGATLDVAETLSRYATATLDGMTGSAVRLLEDETFVFRTVDDATVILGGPIPGTGGEGIFEQVISLDDGAAVSESRPGADSGVPNAGSTVVDSATTTQPPSSVDLEATARHHPIARPAGTSSARVIPTSATSSDVPAADAPAIPGGEAVPTLPVTPEDAVTTSTAARDTTRGGSSTQDLAALAAAIFIALALVRWSRREAEFRYSPVFLSLAERPG